MEASAASAVLRQMWVTPIYQANLFTSPAAFAGARSPEYLKEIEHAVLGRYDSIPTTSHGDLNRADSLYPLDQMNEVKYKQCLESKGAACKPVYPFRFELLQLFYQHLAQYLTECGVSTAELPSTGRDLDLAFSLWASVHGNGSYHLAHHHQNSLVSGVLYAAVPPGSGDFVAHDPRGQLPPFGRSQHFAPKLGDILLFPSWLMHSVLPTLSPSPRVSISFNFFGTWEATTDINLGYVI